MNLKENSSKSGSAIERRKFVRVLEKCSVSFVSVKGSTGEGELIDVALRGMSFLSENHLSKGEKIRVIFMLGNGISLDLSGIVRHANPAKGKTIYGMEFSIRDYRDLKEHLKLKSYIAHVHVKQDQFLKKEVLKKKIY
jgi:hypothetical protein